jgi:hypothetical protein
MVMSLNDLKLKVMETVRNFKPQPNMIKQRIDFLIEAEYMERDPNDRAKLIYLP